VRLDLGLKFQRSQSHWKYDSARIRGGYTWMRLEPTCVSHVALYIASILVNYRWDGMYIWYKTASFFLMSDTQLNGKRAWIFLTESHIREYYNQRHYLCNFKMITSGIFFFFFRRDNRVCGANKFAMYLGQSRWYLSPLVRRKNDSERRHAPLNQASSRACPRDALKISNRAQ